MTTTSTNHQLEAGELLPVSAEIAIAARRLEIRAAASKGTHREVLLRVVETLRRLCRAVRQVED